MKKLVVIATGWHFPLHFYRRMQEQRIPAGWEVHYVCVSHRDPIHAVDEKDKLPDDLLGQIDKVLYEKIATQQEIEQLGWKYMLEPNTIGDWEYANQWMAKNKQNFDVMLITHDDNYIIGNDLFGAVLVGAIRCLIYNDWENGKNSEVDYDDNWLCISNSFIEGKPHLRGSFDFFKKELIDMMGGKFDLSHVNLTREGQVDNPQGHSSLGNWNGTVLGMIGFMREHKLFDRVKFLSNTYRVSNYCIEGERGFISRRAVESVKYERAVKNLMNGRDI